MAYGAQATLRAGTEAQDAAERPCGWRRCSPPSRMPRRANVAIS